jgi:predicted transcriptional regulator
VKHENPSQAFDIDMFGNPSRPLRDRRGRPSFAKSKENQEFVAVRAAAGWSQNRIADALGCDDDTLRKHFSGELENGRMIVEGVMLDVLMRKVREGHVPSIRQLQERMDATAPAAPHKKKDEASSEDKKVAKGKKEQRLDDAQNVPDEYGSIYARRRVN